MDEQYNTSSETSGTKESDKNWLQEYLDEIEKVPKLSKEQEMELAARIQAGDEEAKERLVEANLTLAAGFAMRYQGRGLDLVDLIQEGNLGLMRAADEYKPDREYRFSGYASWWIKNYITKAIAAEARRDKDMGKLVDEINRMMKVREELRQELGREPDEGEIAERLEVPAERVPELKKIAESSLSFDAKPPGEDNENGGEDLEGQSDQTEELFFKGTSGPPEVPSEEEEERMKQLEEQLRVILESDLLTEREQKVIRFRYGLDDGRERTLEEVCREFGLTRERIRQIESKAFHKIRSELSEKKKRKDFPD